MLLDDSGAPLIRITFSEVSDSEYEAAVAAIAAVFARQQPVVVIIDITNVSGAVTVERRAHVARLMATIQADADRLMRGAIYIAPTVLGRGIVTALNWVRGKRPYPVKIVATEAEALEKARELL